MLAVSIESMQGRIQVFIEGEPTPSAKLCQKLHENLENWTKRAVHKNLDPPLACCFEESLENKKIPET